MGNRIVLVVFFVMLSSCVFGQVLNADRANIRQSIRLDGKTITEISLDSTFSAATHSQVSTSKAIKDYIDQLPDNVGADSLYIDGNIFILFSEGVEINRDTLITAGQSNTGQNVGGEVEVYKGMSGDVLQFRTISGENGLDVQQDGDVIRITPIYLFFPSDAAAAAGGVQIGQMYKLDIGNPYGGSYGAPRIRVE